MKNRVYSLLIGTAFGLVTCGASYAMSGLVSMTMEPEWPATAQPGTVVLYKVSVVREGKGLLDVSLSSKGLPDGATVSFSPRVLRFTGRTPTTLTSLMTVTCTNVTPTDSYSFTVTSQALRDAITITNQISPELRAATAERPVLFMDPVEAGSVRIRGQGAFGQTYQIESTPDLGNPVWTPSGSSTADGNGRFTFVATDVNDTPMRFFRAVWPAPAAAPQQ